MDSNHSCRDDCHAADSADAIRTQLDRVLSDPLFVDAPRLSQLLRHLVANSLAGHERELLEYSVAMAVFGSGASFDPRIDTIVRVQARRLRGRLGDYYRGPGAHDPIVFEIPKGHYRVTFRSHHRPADSNAPADGADASAGRVQRRWRYAIWGAAAVLVAATAWSGRMLWVQSPITGDPPVAVAVLPFTNMSADPTNAHLSDGLSEEILNELARYPGLQVTARTTSFAFKESNYESSRISKLLGVRYLLLGSLRREGPRLRVTAQLVDDRGVQIWSQAYDRELGDAFEIQRGIAYAVVNSIVPQVAPATAAVRPPNPEAYPHYLLGREILTKRLPGFAPRSALHFARAIEIDPNYAEAHAEQANSLISGARWTDNEAGQFDEAQRSIDTALSLNPNLPQAHAAQGKLYLLRRPPAPARSERAFRKALDLDSNHTDARIGLANALAGQGRYVERFEEMQHVARLDPFSPGNLNLARGLAEKGELQQAERLIARQLDLPFPQHLPHLMLTHLYTEYGRLADANTSAKQSIIAYVASHGRVGVLDFLADNYARLGMWAQADQWHDQLEAMRPESVQVVMLRAASMQRQGRHQEALHLIDAELQARSLAPSQLAVQSRVEYALLLIWTGHYGRAIDLLQPTVNGGPLLTGDNAPHALAWAYLQTGSARNAIAILDAIERDMEQRDSLGMLALSGDRFLYAQNALLVGDEALAIDRLRQAAAAGWRDCYGLRHSPMWAPLLNQPHLVRLLQEVESDVREQRRKVEARESTDGFTSQLDALLTTRLPSHEPAPRRAAADAQPSLTRAEFSMFSSTRRTDEVKAASASTTSTKSTPATSSATATL
jgi:TolB-like protein/Tfp pilus assembly protein PilF